ncbi:MAG TPA: energy transducer TonB [Terriglobales bacterium]|nr:energy transducer TonB [Terriglobales bacterium]
MSTRSSMGASGHSSADLSGARRRIPRYPVAVPVDVTVLRAGLPSSIPGRSLDIGEGGVAAMLAAELQTGEWVAVEFQLPNAVHPLQTKAVVRHHNQLRCGFEFLGLSRDQRYMIRHWAGSAQPEQSPLESPVIALPAKPPTALAHVPATARSRSKSLSAPTRRLLWMTLGLLLVAGSVAAWEWHRGWQQLQARTAKNDAHAQPPAAKVPAEVMERLLLRKVEPVYSEAARRANLQGVVVLDAVIAADGSVVSLHPLSGPDGLAAAAMDAARWWRFRPYRVQGEPAVVETSLAVEFRP